MTAFVQNILATAVLLLAIADEYKGNNEESCNNSGDGGHSVGGSCCQAPGNQSVVIIKGEKDGCIECRETVKEKKEKINWYQYGNEKYGLEIFTKVNETHTKYMATRNGGIFICTTEKNETSVTSKNFCNSHKTFIISPANDIHENKNKSAIYEKGETVTLECHVNLTVSYALLWIATHGNGRTKCLSSVEVLMESHSYNISNNNLCCPTGGIYQRCNQTHPHHYLDIQNITDSQSGEYLCTVFFFSRGAYLWKGVNKTFIQVTNHDEVPTDIARSIVPYIVSGAIGGLVVICASLCLVRLCLKHKGKEKKENDSQSVAPPTEYECTPYAVSAGQDNHHHTVYSYVQKPASGPVAEYAEVELTPLAACSGAEYSEVGTGPQVEPISEYSEVGKEPHCVPNKEYSKTEATYSVLNY